MYNGKFIIFLICAFRLVLRGMYFTIKVYFSILFTKRVILKCKKLRPRMRITKVGVDEDANEPANNNRLFLSVLDTLLSSIVIAPAVIAYWRGTWYLSDFFIFPNNIEINLIVSTIVGTLAQIIFTFAQEYLQKNCHPEKHRISFYVISRLYTYVYSVACVNLWRGGWKALDFYSGTDPVQVVVPTVISLAVLAGMKTVRNLSSAPFVVVLDMVKGYFQVPTMFKLTGSSEISLYILDCFFSVFVIGSLVVFVWRGVWCLTDVFLFPENDKLSALTSTAIGYGIVILIFSIQRPMEKICDKLKGFWRILIADIYVLVSFVGTINLWRGIWNLLNIYFLPESPLLSCWITHLGSFAFLILINCSNSVLVRGVYLDGEEGGKCVVFPIFYLRLIFEDQLRKKTENNQVNYKISSLSVISPDLEKGQKQNSDFTKGSIQSSDTTEGKS